MAAVRPALELSIEVTLVARQVEEVVVVLRMVEAEGSVAVGCARLIN